MKLEHREGRERSEEKCWRGKTKKRNEMLSLGRDEQEKKREREKAADIKTRGKERERENGRYGKEKHMKSYWEGEMSRKKGEGNKDEFVELRRR